MNIIDVAKTEITAEDIRVVVRNQFQMNNVQNRLDLYNAIIRAYPNLNAWYFEQAADHGKTNLYNNVNTTLNGMKTKQLVENTERCVWVWCGSKDELYETVVSGHRSANEVETVEEVEMQSESQDVTNEFDLIKLYVKLGIFRLEDTDALLVRAMSNDITNEERDFLRKIYVGEIQ